MKTYWYKYDHGGFNACFSWWPLREHGLFYVMAKSNVNFFIETCRAVTDDFGNLVRV